MPEIVLWALEVEHFRTSNPWHKMFVALNHQICWLNNWSSELLLDSCGPFSFSLALPEVHSWSQRSSSCKELHFMKNPELLSLPVTMFFKGSNHNQLLFSAMLLVNTEVLVQHKRIVSQESNSKNKRRLRISCCVGCYIQLNQKDKFWRGAWWHAPIDVLPLDCPVYMHSFVLSGVKCVVYTAT